jgi:signal transduction histidine kinase
MVAAPVDYSIQPYTGTDLAALVLAIAAVHCLTIRLRDREAGMGWFAAAMASLAVWVGANRLHLPSGPELNPSAWYFLSSAAGVFVALGLAAYVQPPRREGRWVLGLVIGSAAAFSLLVVWVMLTGAVVMRARAHGLTALAYLAMGSLVMQAARREPGAGHFWLGLALLSVPALAVTLALTGTDPVALRYWAVAPLMLLGLTLPTVSLMRRQRALRAEVERRAGAERSLAALNDSLEAKVAARTADLQSMVAGLESFNRSVSHDLQGPLGGMAELARVAGQALEQGDATLARRALPAIAHQAQTSNELVASLLELARVADSPLSLRRLDPAAIAQEVIEQFRLAAKSEPLPRFTIQPLPTVEADPTLLRAVLCNLIGNAIKFTRERGDGQVELSADTVSNQVCLQVRDNGIGFDATEAAAAFAPFQRLHDATYAGHGIGLSIVRRAVERHGGKVWAESSPGQGACFSFTLPAAA